MNFYRGWSCEIFYTKNCKFLRFRQYLQTILFFAHSTNHLNSLLDKLCLWIIIKDDFFVSLDPAYTMKSRHEHHRSDWLMEGGELETWEKREYSKVRSNEKKSPGIATYTIYLPHTQSFFLHSKYTRPSSKNWLVSL